MAEVIRYIIDLEPGQLETVTELLTKAKVRFTPVAWRRNEANEMSPAEWEKFQETHPETMGTAAREKRE